MASQDVWVKSGAVRNILPQDQTTTTLTGAWMFKDAPNASYQVVVSGTGTVTATVIFDVSNDGINAVTTTLGTVTLSGTTTASDGFTTSAPWKYVRARVTAITGTGAIVNVYACV